MPSTSKSRQMCTATTWPSTRWDLVGSPCMSRKTMIWVNLHSRETGLSATLGGAMISDGRGVRPESSNSSTSGGTEDEDLFIASARGRVARFHTKQPVASTLQTLSFRPCEEKPMIGGLRFSMLKKLNGARMSLPSASCDEIQPIGRGPMIAISGSCFRRWPLIGSYE